MASIDRFIESLYSLDEPRDRWQQLESFPEQDHPRIVEEKLWWQARYRFVDRKKSQTADKFLWLMLSAATLSPKIRGDRKTVQKAFEGAVLSLHTEKAKSLNPDRFLEELTAAAAFYVRTIDTRNRVFGFTVGKEPTADETLGRIAQALCDTLFPCLYHSCGELPDAALVVQGAFAGAKRAYPAIPIYITARLEQAEDSPCKAFLLEHAKPLGIAE